MKRYFHRITGSRSQSYQYDELPRDGSFRYLILYPGTGNDPLRCSLQTATLSKTTFEAISYVWGSSEKTNEISCDGRVIKITQSLSNVLGCLRLPHKRRKLWADGICINQDDLREKGHQVAIMGDIYRLAQRVLIYIGSDDSGHGPQVSSLLDDVNRMIDDTCKQIDMTWDAFPYPQEDDPIMLDSRWKSLCHLSRQDWFKRGWVVREASFAQYGQVIWSQSAFSWEKLMRANMWLMRRAPTLYLDPDLDLMTCHSEAYRQHNKSFARVFWSEPSWKPASLLKNLNDAKSLQLSDTRDRIYAFMELSRSSERVVTIEPNYNLAPLEIYRQFAMQYIRETKDIQILEYVEYDSGSIYSEIPSWVPRWDIDRYPLPTRFSSDGVPLSSRDGSICEPRVIDQELLSARGIVADSIRYVSDKFEHDFITPQTVRELWAITSLMLNDSPYEPSHRLDAFLDTLSFGTYSGEWWNWRRSRNAFKAYVQPECDMIHSERSHHDHLSSNKVFGLVQSHMHETRFIVTERGYIGLAPAVTQKDDHCGIVFGCKTPCILRHTPEDKYYKFLGATFLMGKRIYHTEDGGISFYDPLGHEDSKDWVEWDIEEQDIYLV